MRQGEIWRVRLPSADGHEQSGERPALILQDDAFIHVLPLVLVVPFTSRMRATRFPGTLLVQPDSVNGLTSPSVALLFQLRGLDKSRFLERLGKVEEATLRELWSLLDQLTGRENNA
jgi:mRNA interferase MazF